MSCKHKSTKYHDWPDGGEVEVCQECGMSRHHIEWDETDWALIDVEKAKKEVKDALDNMIVKTENHVFEIGDCFINKASYCGNCAEENPCQKCLEMCNKFVISGKHKTTYGWDYFFGGHWANIDGGCILDTPMCYVLTTDMSKVNPLKGIVHISQALPISNELFRELNHQS